MPNWNTQSLVTWTYNLNDNTGFLLQISRNSGSTWPTSVYLTSSAITSYYDNDVTWGDSRWYRIAAINNDGIGKFSHLGYVYIQGGAWFPSFSPNVSAMQVTSSVPDNFFIQVQYQQIPYGATVDDAFLANWGGWGLNSPEIINVRNQSRNPITVVSASLVGSGFTILSVNFTLPRVFNYNDNLGVVIEKNVSGPQSSSLVVNTDSVDNPIIIYMQGA